MDSQLVVSFLMVLADLAFKSLLIAGVAWCALRLWQHQDAALAHRVWSLVLAGMLCLPLLSMLVPQVPALPHYYPAQTGAVSSQPIGEAVAYEPPPTPKNAEQSVLSSSQTIEPARSLEPVSYPPIYAEEVVSPQLAPLSEAVPLSDASSGWLPVTAIAACIAYCLVASLLVGRLMLGLVLAHRLVDRATPIDRHVLGIPAPDGARLVESAEVQVPITTGMWRQAIVLPEDWQSWSSELLRMALAHESEHVRRGDAWFLLASQLNTAFYWFHPVAWLVRRKLSDLAEQICDDAVIVSTRQPAAYAKSLLTMAERITAGGHRVVPHGVAMARLPNLEQRIDAVIDSDRLLTKRLSMALGMLLLAVAVPIIALVAGLVPAAPALAQAEEIEADSKEPEANETVVGEVDQGDREPIVETEPVLLGKFPARLIAVYPGDGASDVRPDTLLRMRFDAPIDPSAFSLKWDRGGFLDTGSFSYLPEANELTVPVTLGTAKDHRVVLGGGPVQSLRGADGLEVASISWEFATLDNESAPMTALPTLESISPQAGSQVPRVAWIRAQFDKPVDVTALRLETAETRKLDSKMPRDLLSLEAPPLFEIDDSRKFVAIPVVFPAGWEGDLRVKIGGAKPFTVAYAATDELINWGDAEFAQTPEAKAELRSIVERTRAARRDLRSAVVETTSRDMSAAARDDILPFRSVRFTSGQFRFQGDKQFVGNVSGWMRGQFAIGSDGETSWFLIERRGDNGNKRLEMTRCNNGDIEDIYVAIADAFASKQLDLDRVIKERRLSLVGKKPLKAATCHVVRSWDVRDHRALDRIWVTVTDWWIDSESCLPRRVVKHFSGGSKQVIDLSYAQVNEPMPDSAFEPPQADVATQVDMDPLGEGYSKRFLKVSDGSDGKVSGRWGKYGSRGRSSSGLN